MELRRMLSRVTGPVTWQILRLMMHRDFTAEELENTLDVKPSTSRTHIKRLREAGFVGVKNSSRPKRYGLVDSLPSAVHEIVMLFASLDESTNIYDPEQVREQLESMRPTFGETEWFDGLLEIIANNYPHPGLTRDRG